MGSSSLPSIVGATPADSFDTSSSRMARGSPAAAPTVAPGAGGGGGAEGSLLQDTASKATARDAPACATREAIVVARRRLLAALLARIAFTLALRLLRVALAGTERLHLGHARRVAHAPHAREAGAAEAAHARHPREAAHARH